MRDSQQAGRRRRVGFAAVVSLVVGLVVLGSRPPASAGDPVTVTVTILRVTEVSCDEGALVPCPDDPYARVDINNLGFQESGYIDNPSPPDVRPYWTFSRIVDSDLGSVPVVIQIWDDDDTSADDKLDACGPGNDIDVVVDLATGTWTGDTNIGFCLGSHVKVAFDITTSGSRDFDGDGIPDGVERFGVRDANGVVVADMAALGADPCRPDIAVEIDFMNGDPDGHTHQPLPAALAEATAMFANAPVNSPPGCPYPGFPTSPTGIGLITVVDDAIGEAANLEWSTGGEAIRDANFSSDLRPYFHYSLWTHQRSGDNAGSSGVCCSNSGRDPLVSLGGWTNDVGSVREQSGTFVHELGHALGFGHGGGDGTNCKPNYLSVMSYSFQVTGIGDPTLPANNVDTDNDGLADSRLRLDFSGQTLPTLNEAALDETVGISDGTDLTVWSFDGGANINSAAGNGAINWDGDTLAGGAPNIETSVSVDINDLGFSGCEGAGSTLAGSNDWANIKYRAAVSPDAGFSPAPADEIDFETAQVIRTQLVEALTPDLTVDLTASPDPVLTGSELTWTATVANTGLMPADDVEVAFTAPAGTSPTGCTTSAGGTCSGTTADFALLPAGATATATFTTGVECALPDGTLLNGMASISSTPADADDSNNTASATAVADNPPPVISGLTASPGVLWPPSHTMRNVQLSYTVTDNCGTPSLDLSVASNEAVDGLGDGSSSPDWEVLSVGEVRLRAERSGLGDGRIYTMTLVASDSGGGSSDASTDVLVPKRR